MPSCYFRVLRFAKPRLPYLLFAALVFFCAGCGSGVRNVLGKTVASAATAALHGNDPDEPHVTAVCVDGTKTTKFTTAADCAPHGGVSYFVP